LVTVAVAAYLAVFHFNAPDMDVTVMNAPAPSETATPAHKLDTAPPHVDGKATKPPVADQTPQIKEPGAAPEVKPDEIKQEQTAFDPLLARPVAKDAAPSPKPKGVKAAPPSGKWAIRFGLCVYKSNCDRIIEDLSRKKIEAFITEGVADVTFYKVMVGPFPTQTHAEAAAEKFRAKKMELSPFAVDDQYYLGAASFIDPKAQNAIIETAKSFEYRAEGVSGREPRKVYKVYRNVMFDTKQAAEKAMRYDKEKGVACFIERQD
jgi:cell division septation protein DedD